MIAFNFSHEIYTKVSAFAKKKKNSHCFALSVASGGWTPSLSWQKGSVPAAQCIMSEDDLTESPPVSPGGKVSPSFMRKKSTLPTSKKDLQSSGIKGKAAAADLDDPSLENAEIGQIKDKASDKVNDLIHSLETGSFGAANVRAPRPSAKRVHKESLHERKESPAAPISRN